MEDFKFLCHLLSLPIYVVQWIKLQSTNLELKVLRLKVIFCKISDFHLNASAMTSRFRNNLFVSICLLILSFSFFVAVVIARYMCNNVFEHKYLVPLCVICINMFFVNPILCLITSSNRQLFSLFKIHFLWVFLICLCLLALILFIKYFSSVFLNVPHHGHASSHFKLFSPLG